VIVIIKPPARFALRRQSLGIGREYRSVDGLNERLSEFLVAGKDLVKKLRTVHSQCRGRGFESHHLHHCDVSVFLGHVNPQTIILDWPW